MPRNKYFSDHPAARAVAPECSRWRGDSGIGRLHDPAREVLLHPLAPLLVVASMFLSYPVLVLAESVVRIPITDSAHDGLYLVRDSVVMSGPIASFTYILDVPILGMQGALQYRSNRIDAVIDCQQSTFRMTRLSAFSGTAGSGQKTDAVDATGSIKDPTPIRFEPGATTGYLAKAVCAAYTAQAGVATSNELSTSVTKRTRIVHDLPRNELLAQGDAAVGAQDYSSAWQKYLSASNDSDAKVAACAFNRMGEMVEWGRGQPIAYREYVRLYRLAAERGNFYGAANLGNALFFGPKNYDANSRDVVEAFKWAKIGASGGIALSMNQLGWQYLTGSGTEVDTRLAREWYGKSAATGDALGEGQFGWTYAHVQPIDYGQAMFWYQRAAEQNLDIAQNNIGFLYSNGMGVTRDDREAVRWYRKAADQGYARAKFHLASALDQGLGVEKDRVTARRLMQEAAAAGDGAAQKWLNFH